MILNPVSWCLRGQYHLETELGKHPDIGKYSCSSHTHCPVVGIKPRTQKALLPTAPISHQSDETNVPIPIQCILPKMVRWMIHSYFFIHFSVPSLPPGSLQCTALSSQSVRVTWEPPPMRGRNGVLQGYRVTYAPVTDWYGKLTPTSITILNQCWI